MSKLSIDEHLKGKELFKFLVDNKSQLVAQKRSILKKTDPVFSAPTFFEVKGNSINKTAIGDIAPDATSVRVKVIANTALYFDSQKDVLLPDCWKKTIKDRKGLIPHLHDHIHEIEAEVGEVASIYSQEITLSDLGFNRPGSTQSLIFETDVKKNYNENVFNKYKTGKIKQHSIGLQYVKMELAINDSEYEKELDFWNKYIDLVINKDEAMEEGYMWIVPEIILLENSAVLFGSNRLTQTLEVKHNSLVVCGNCSKQLDYNSIPEAGMGYIKCPNCQTPITQNTKTDTLNEPALTTHEEPLQKSFFDIKQLLKIF